jgi:anti-sigma factor RsiW
MTADAPFERLVQRYVDGLATVDEVAQLNDRLRVDAAARTRFAELLNLDSALAAVAAGYPLDDAAAAAPTVVPPRRETSWSPARLVALAACLAICCAGLWHLRARQAPFATIDRVAGTDERPGASLHGETHVLQAGALELRTALGARIVIEAPAEFRFASATRLHLLRGRLSAEVPPAAKGFTVVTPSGDAVDLGTRFGIDVRSNEAAEIHVFEGEVIAHPSNVTATQSLHGGQALSLNGGTDAARELRSSAFLQPEEFASLTAGLAAGQQARAEQVLDDLRTDAAIIAVYDFETDATYAGTFRMVQGRWPGSHAPEFVNVGDHLQLDVGDDHNWPQLTLAAWVRIDRLGEPYQSLLHTDGWTKNNPGQVHWMLNRNTTMRLALSGNRLPPATDTVGGDADSRTSVLPEQGRWVHLATVYDAERRTVRFYLNGRFDNEIALQIAHPARLGPARIGNWNVRDRKLSGRVDELLLLGRALDDEDIQALFDAGNPYR